MAEKSKLFLVLCLHRSGSSATAGVMHHLGIHMGDNLIPPSRHNKKGYFENQDFVDMNDMLLNSIGGGVWNPPTRDQVIKSSFPSEQIHAFLSNQVKPVWGLKDPRTLLTFEIWKPYFEEIADITYVFVHRPFESSVCSLDYRQKKMNRKTADEILTIYLKNLYYYRHNFGIDKQDIIDVYYEDMLKNPRPFVHEFNKRIGRNPENNLELVYEFLNNNLKHH